ncbi:restriction endonuclease subunit S [Flavobacteriaceae bacterium]|nr:restriction endonuclease subunit S [Flavobacteriaceae bacterium]
MDSVLMENKVLKLDKSNWKLTKVGELAKDISKRVDNPIESGYDRFVGLNHFISGDIKIKNWGPTKSLTSSTKAFEAGDILFARRNAYLRRASLVDFDGCCSGDAFVLRENHEKVVPGFLAFFMNSNALWDYANSNAAGTMSKRVKWRDLAEYEIFLPPIDQQTQLVKLLWAMDDVICIESGLFKNIDDLLKVKRESLIIDKNYPLVRLDEICDKKISYGIVQAGPDIASGMPYIKSSNLSEDGIRVEELQRTSDEIAQKYKRSEVLPGNIVFSLRGNLGEMNIVPDELEVANLTQGTARLSVKNEYSTGYVKCALESSKIQRRIHALSKGSTFKEISLETLRTVKIPIPKEEKAKEIFEVIKTIENNRKRIKAKCEVNKTLLKSLINQIF